MTPEETDKLERFLALPPNMAIRIMLQAMPLMVTKKILEMEIPKVPMCPKYDTKIWRTGGYYQWASETQVKSLQFFTEREGNNSNPDYAEKSAKQQKALQYWLDFRLVDPMSAVRIIRDRDEVNAEAPQYKPAQHHKDEGRDRGGQFSDDQEAPF